PHAEGPGPLAERADRGLRWPEPASAGDDLELDLGRHLGVEADRRGVDTGRLDRLADLDLALVDRRATGRLHRGGDVGRRDRTEETAGLTGVRLDRVGLRLDRG